MCVQHKNVKNAGDLLRQLKITKIPIDVEKICAELDISITITDLSQVEKAHGGRPISGALILKNGEKDIIVNQDDIRERQRFTIAHELAHYFLHHCEETVSSTERAIISFRGAKNKVEYEADQFAAELLMPLEHIIRLYEELPLPYITALALKFDVSKAAMRYRLDSLNKNYIDL